MAEVIEKPVTISSLDFENVKRIKAVRLEPSESGLTVIGGRNAQGKTSVLDAICWALGGGKYKPADPRRDGAAGEPSLRVELSNGIVVERKGKAGSLKVTDSTGAKAGQALLDSFVEQFALDVPRFLQATDKDRALTLLRIIGVEDQLREYEKQEASLTQRRLTTGQVERQRRGAVETMAYYPDAPESAVDVAGLAEQQRDALERNAENQRIRDDLEQLRVDRARVEHEAAQLAAQAQVKTAQLAEVDKRIAEAEGVVAGLVDVDVSGMAEAIADAEETNRKVAANNAFICAKAEADELKEEYDALDAEVDRVRADRMALLEGADMPLPGLSVEGDRLMYNGHAWADMSGSEQMRVATAIVRRINPACGFVLVDKLEQMDAQTLAEFAAWCEGEGLQVIGTRVSTGGECSVVIEDGMVVRAADSEPTDAPVAADAASAALQQPTKTIEPLMAFAAAEGRAF